MRLTNLRWYQTGRAHPVDYAPFIKSQFTSKMDCKAFGGTNLVALLPKFRGNEMFVVHRVVGDVLAVVLKGKSGGTGEVVRERFRLSDPLDLFSGF